jgi:hypothetical protein
VSRITYEEEEEARVSKGLRCGGREKGEGERERERRRRRRRRRRLRVSKALILGRGGLRVRELGF